MILRNKCGGIPESFSWFVGFLIIIFFCILFLAGVSYSKAKSIPLSFGVGGNNVEGFGEGGCEKALSEALIKFVNYPVALENDYKTIKEFISEDNLSDNLFKDSSDEVFSSSFPKSSWKGGEPPWWIKVYGSDGKEIFSNGGRICESKEEGIYEPREDIVYEVLIKDKKVVACLLRTYCSD